MTDLNSQNKRFTKRDKTLLFYTLTLLFTPILVLATQTLWDKTLHGIFCADFTQHRELQNVATQKQNGGGNLLHYKLLISSFSTLIFGLVLIAFTIFVYIKYHHENPRYLSPSQ